jgi:hypothetical protein
MNPITFVESGMHFSFDASKWTHLIQYDAVRDYKKLENAIEKTKAVDFLGVLDNRILSFIEVKNFKGHRIENKPRVENGDDPLELEVAQKVRDTLAGISGAVRHSTNLKNHFATYHQFIANSKKDIHVVLWLEEDNSPLPTPVRDKRNKGWGGNLTARLRKKMIWLTPHVSVVDSESNPYSDSLNVTFLPNQPA